MLERDIALLAALVAASFTFIGLALSLGLTASRPKLIAWAMLVSGVAMILVSAVELVPTALGSGLTALEAVVWLVGGLVLYFVLDRGLERYSNQSSRLRRAAFTVAIALSLHNLPEGAATVAAHLGGLESALGTAAALALHNVPEGAVIALVAIAGGLKRNMAILLVTISAMAEATGALAFWVFEPQTDAKAAGVTLLIVAALMLAISLVELLPRAFATLSSETKKF